MAFETRYCVYYSIVIGCWAMDLSEYDACVHRAQMAQMHHIRRSVA